MDPDLHAAVKLPEESLPLLVRFRDDDGIFIAPKKKPNSGELGSRIAAQNNLKDNVNLINNWY